MFFLLLLVSLQVWLSSTFLVACNWDLSIDKFLYIKIHTWLQGLKGIKQQKSSWSLAMNNSFPLFYYPKPRIQIYIFKCKKSIRFSFPVLRQPCLLFQQNNSRPFSGSHFTAFDLLSWSGYSSTWDCDLVPMQGSLLLVSGETTSRR